MRNIKKGGSLLREIPSIRYQFIDTHPEFDIQLQCRILGVSKSGFYDWGSRPFSNHERCDTVLLPKFVECFEQSQQTYGHLKDLGEDVNHKRVTRLKQKYDIYLKQHKKFVVTTDSTQGRGVAKNILSRQFTV